MGKVQGKSIEKLEGGRVHVAVAWWDDVDGKGTDRWSEGFEIAEGGENVRLERCQIRFRPF